MNFIRTVNFFGILVTLLAIAGIASGAIDPNIDIAGAFRQYHLTGRLDISVPTVTVVPINDSLWLERSDFAVLDTTTNKFQPNLVVQEMDSESKFTSTSPMATPGTDRFMKDGDYSTYAEFNLTDDNASEAVFTLRANALTPSSRLTMALDNYVALPVAIEIRALTAAGEKIVVAKTDLKSTTVNFPETSASTWLIKLFYSQPLRITELNLTQKDIIAGRSLRFLAQPKHEYAVYFNPDRFTRIPVGESSDLSNGNDLLKISPLTPLSNPEYRVADIDNDGIADIRDNCVSISNPDQLDINANGRGDSCDDFDKDSVMNIKDNCVNNPNYRQEDTDNDGLGDVCDNEESRLTERFSFLPWVGIIIAAGIMLTLIVVIVQSVKNDRLDKPSA